MSPKHQTVVAKVKADFGAGMRRGGSLPPWFILKTALLSRGVSEDEAIELAKSIRVELEAERQAPQGSQQT